MNDQSRQAARRRYELLQRRADATRYLIEAALTLRAMAVLLRLADRQLAAEGFTDVPPWSPDDAAWEVGHLRGFDGGEALLEMAMKLANGNASDGDERARRD